ncbi:MAG: aldehyde ferredoxin oxidoreductase C-terminal domain-containing protein, partial [Chloroflexota bacterium]|nr:aldehyde ferredoxin oxidoreductase C-terminal domain-containing protein [Chloroflexota bacterium]
TNRLAYDIIKPDTEPLSPENAIILGAGPFAGTPIPGSGKVMATTKFPMTKAIGTAVGGGSLGPMMKFAGYDHVIITGRAEKPVYLKLDEKPEIIDAGDLWGKDIFETTDVLWNRHGTGPRGTCSVFAIGAPGEKQIYFSLGLVDKIGHLGRGGMAAVVGSKNLKAIVACPSDKGIKVADPDKVMELIQTIYQRIRTDPLFDRWVKDGVRIGWAGWCKGEGFAKNNWREIYSGSEARKLYDSDRFHDIFRYRPLCCFGCPLADKAFCEVKQGEFQGLKTYFSEYLQYNLAFSIYSDLRDDYNKIMKCADYANREGLDVLTLSVMLGFLTELYERGIVTKEDTGGIEPKLGDFDTVMQVMHQMANREGIGALTADGWQGLFDRFPGSEKYAVVIKGQEQGHMDIRPSFGPEGFDFIIEPRGPNGPNAEGPTVLPQRTSDKVWKHCDDIGVPQEIREKMFDTPSVFSTPLFALYLQDWFQLLSALDICVRQQIAMRYDIENLTELYTAVTGFEMNPTELQKTGARILNLIKALNVREGFDRKDDTFPDRWFEPLQAEGKEVRLMDYYRKRELNRDDLNAMLDEYYTERGWDVKKGIPTRETLTELGMRDIAEDLAKQGRL